jgi:3'-phosphoadenosine 5'-phosphosulfate sulfotransferase (PAPS reductase)/FAD synthetase
MSNDHVEIEMWPIDAVVPYNRSLKIRSHVKIRSIAESIQTYGFDQPIVVDSDGVIIKGIGRLEAAKFLGCEEVPVVKNESLTAVEIIQSRIIDNKSAESDWDLDFLWHEVQDLTHEGLNPEAFGFDLKTIRNLFPGMLTDYFEEEFDTDSAGNPKEYRGESADDGLPDFSQDSAPTGVVLSYEGTEDAWKNELSIIDYLHMHDTVILNFSGGKGSVATLFWCIDNGLKDKLFVVYGNIGWGAEYPDIYRYIKYIEDKTNTTIHSAGSSNPRHPGGIEDGFIQFGFPEQFNCWIESEIRNSRINAVLKNEGFQRQSNNLGEERQIVQLISVRASRGPKVTSRFPDRGQIMNSNINFASPIYYWKDLDIIKYLDSKECKLPEVYKTQNHTNCFLCPNNTQATAIYIRKRYPKLWAKVLDYYAEGGRFTQSVSESVFRWIADITDETFSADYSSMVLSDTRLESIMRREVMDKYYRNSAHKILDDALQGQPIYKSVTDQYDIKICGG